MSDYLWDKTGEPDAETERLEELLGQLRFQPRTFEASATLPVVPRHATPARAPFNWSRLAVAASLILTLLLGAWLIASKQRTLNAPGLVDNRPATEEKTTQQPTDREAATATPGNDPATARNEKPDNVVRRVAPTVSHQPRDVTFVAVRKRFGARPRHLNKRDLNEPHEEVARMTPQEKDAMEKFMLAMKVTSEKLGYAERQVAGLSHDSPRR